MELVWLVLLLGGGLALLLASANYFIDSIAAIAEAMGASPLVIGMTVVAFGTSLPELVVNVLSASRGETALAFGNIAGSCIVNTGFVLGVTAMVRPLKVESALITREIPMLIVAVAALLILTFDGTLERTDGGMLVLLFGIFLYYTVIYSVAKRLIERGSRDAFVEEVSASNIGHGGVGLRRPVLIGLAGLAGVSVGADWTVSGATGLARLVNMSENMIGLTVVSLGTTLPELITCVMAARRGNADIALGNVVGSNIFNILAIGGLVAAVRPVAVPAGGPLDLWCLAALTAVLLPVAIRSGQRITRGEGAFLFATYAAYLLFRVLTEVR
jgi:cation:H+ antiporter